MNFILDDNQITIKSNLSISEIERKYEKIDYEYEKFYCIDIEDLNKNQILKKAIGYNSINEPTFCYSSSVKGFQIISDEYLLIYDSEYKEYKLEFMLPIISLFYSNEFIYVIYEIGLAKVSVFTKKIIFNKNFSDTVEDFNIDKDTNMVIISLSGDNQENIDLS